MRRAHHRSRWKRRRVTLLAVVVVLVGLAAYAGVSVAGLHDVPHAKPNTTEPLPPSTSTSSPPASTSTTTQPPADRIGSYATATTSIDVADASTSASTVQTTIWFPADHGSSGLVPDRASAPYPMIVFSQGYEVAVAQYSSLLSSWASAGFVVAAPTYPHTATSDPADLDEADIVNHPADLRLVLSSLVADSSHPGWVLSGMINGDEIGLAGHSDGGEVSLAVADNTCCRYTGVKALAVLSGAELTSFGGEYFPGTSPPLLVVQGNADTVNPPACSAQIFDSAPQPKYYLDLLGAGHLTPYIQPTAYEGVVARTTTAFFAAELAGQAAELAALPSVADVGNVATLTTAPATTGDCPGAP